MVRKLERTSPGGNASQTTGSGPTARSHGGHGPQVVLSLRSSPDREVDADPGNPAQGHPCLRATRPPTLDRPKCRSDSNAARARGQESSRCAGRGRRDPEVADPASCAGVVSGNASTSAVTCKGGRSGKLPGLVTFLKRYPKAQSWPTGGGGVLLAEFFARPATDWFK
jgi:hypothetical protein